MAQACRLLFIVLTDRNICRALLHIHNHPLKFWDWSERWRVWWVCSRGQHRTVWRTINCEKGREQFVSLPLALPILFLFFFLQHILFLANSSSFPVTHGTRREKKKTKPKFLHKGCNFTPKIPTFFSCLERWTGLIYKNVANIFREKKPPVNARVDFTLCVCVRALNVCGNVRVRLCIYPPFIFPSWEQVIGKGRFR